MTKPKTLEQLRAEKEQVETQLAQEQHKLERLENRKKYLEKGERQKRTHRLCNLGGTIESLAPEFKDRLPGRCLKETPADCSCNVLWLQALLLFCFHLGNSFGFLKEASQNRCGYWQW